MTEQPWIKSYPAGVRWDAELPTMPVQEILNRTVARWPDNSVIEFMGKRTSYRQLEDLTNRAAKGLQQLGVRPGVHVGLFLPNTPHYFIAFFGVLKAGGTVVNYSPLDAEKTLEHKIADSETDIMVTLDLAALYPQMTKLAGRTRLKKLVIGNVGEMTPHPDAVQAQLRSAKQLSEIPSNQQHLGFGALLDNDGRYEPHPIADPNEAVAVLQYTGGTTGEPKGAMLSHANLSVACAQLCHTVDGDPKVLEEGKERFLAILPPFHIYSVAVNMLFCIRIGAEVIIHMRFDPEAVVKDLAAKRVTVFPGVPTMYTAIVHYPNVDHYDLRSLKFCSSAGAPLPLKVNEDFRRLTGCDLVEGWGMTETSPTGTFTPVLGKRKRGSCGLPVPGVTLKFASVDDPSKYVPRGERGEILVSGPNVMKGYWKKPEATAAAMTADGFLRTGDVGCMDEDGFVYIVDRTKDMILCGGYNVYPRNIEEAIIQHPSVAEVSVIGIPDQYRGQSPKAFIALKLDAPTITLEGLQAFLKDKLAKYEMVQAMEIRAELPKTAVGKLSKKELYEEEAQKRAMA